MTLIDGKATAAAVKAEIAQEGDCPRSGADGGSGTEAPSSCRCACGS